MIGTGTDIQPQSLYPGNVADMEAGNRPRIGYGAAESAVEIVIDVPLHLVESRWATPGPGV
jgi:hypothetical protein